MGQPTSILFTPEDRAAGAEPSRAEPGEAVLVDEDEPVIRDLIVEVLQDLGYRALEAAGGPSGLKIFQSRKRIDLLVNHVGLPGLNGRQLADQRARNARTWECSSSPATPRTLPSPTAF